MMKPNARSPSLTSQDSYSAVIIADLVADVPVVSEAEQEVLKQTRERNLSHDGHTDGQTSPAVINVDSAELGNLCNVKANGSGISKGVILNAVQFGQQEPKTKGDEKPMHLTNSLRVQVLKEPVSEPHGFKDMSVLRKIAFGFSFLPSVLFILCFAIILPCNVPKPCIEQMWRTPLNNTEVTSRLEIPQNVMFTVVEGSDNYLMTLNEKTGYILSKEKFFNGTTFLICGNIVNDTQKDCIVVDELGKYIFSTSNGNILWNPVSEDGEQPSLPILLPDCNKDKLQEIAVAVSNTKIKVLYSGNIVSSFEISNCDSVPTRLMVWSRENSSDLIFVCEKDGKDRLMKVPQNVWCIYDKESQGNTLIFHSAILNSTKDYVLHPTEDGLMMWSEDEVSMIDPDGSILWKMSNYSHSAKNRFVLHGKFHGENKQVALLSSDLASQLEVTVLDAHDGSLVKNASFPNFEATEVTHIHGKEKDFAVMLLKKRKTNLVAEALTHINDVSTTIINLLASEKVNDTELSITNEISEEITFLDFDGTFHSIQELEHTSGAGNKDAITVSYCEKENILHIYLLTTSKDPGSTTVSEIRKIDVANWDISATKALQCITK